MVYSRSRGLDLRRLFALAVSVLVLSISVLPGSHALGNQVLAQGPCTVTDLNPHSAPDGSTTGFAFTVTDNNDALAWIRVTSPSASVAIVNGSSDWLPNVTTSSSHADFSGDPIAAGNPLQVNVSASINAVVSGTWAVQASTDSGGANPMTCSGDTSFSTIDTIPPNILTISASATTTTASIHWTTDKSTTGAVDYGTTSAYGLHKTVSTFATAHTVSITGLHPATVYHYQITATDQSSNTTQSIDGTFLTASPTTSSSGSSGVTVTNKHDKIPPTIRITSTLPRVFTAPPVVHGVATDNDRVAAVEYSTDGGKDWLPVDEASGLGGKQVSFTFHPLNLVDDTYTFKARATDAGGNTATTKGFTVVIDRLPPVLGGDVVALGPQVLLPNSLGNLQTLTGVPLSFHASSTGGSITIAINAVAAMPNSTTASPSFTLQQAPDSGLWSGVLSFSYPGTYTLIAHARDGANNTTSRTIGTVEVAQAGRIMSPNGPVANALVSVYYRDPDSNDWVIWDGLPYDQTNPQATNTHGTFQMFLPAGTYYLHVSALGYQDLNTASFTLRQPTPLTAALRMTQGFGVGPVQFGWFNFGIAEIKNIPQSSASNSAAPSLVNKPLPALTLTDTTDKSQNSVNWLGKPTLVTLLSTWVPATSEQLNALSQLAQNHDLNIEVIGLQENSERLRAYDAIAGSNLVWLADPDSQSVNVLHAGSLPMHYFVDRKGIVRAVDYGVLSYDQLLNTLVNLP